MCASSSGKGGGASALPKDTMKVQVLPDGTVKAQTGDMSGPQHKAADDFLKELARLMGGTVEVDQVRDRQHHHHHTDQEHLKA